MIILDTCAIIYDALDPKQLSKAAKLAIEQHNEKKSLYCCDISLWEIAMLIQKKRIKPDVDSLTFLELVLQARSLQILSITAEIAALSVMETLTAHFDPADRIIAATTIYYQSKLVTADKNLLRLSKLETIW